jgi:hypothetical protein
MVWKKALSTVAILVFSLAISNTSFADLALKKYSFFNNSKGLNDTLSSVTVSDNEATDLQNVVFDTAGAISKRYGFQNITGTKQAFQVGNGNYAVTGLSYYVNQSTGNKYLVAIANVSGQATAFSKQLDGNNNVPAGPWTNIGSTGLPTNYTNDQQPVLTSANNILVMTFPAYTGWKPYAWEATSNVYQFTGNPNCPNATMNAYYNNILFLAGDPANPSRVSFSDLTNGIKYFYPTDFFEIDKNNGHYITALLPAFGNLYVFEDNSIWMITGTSRDTFAIQKMVDNVGTMSPHSVQVVNNTIYFVTKQNDIAIYDGTFTVKFLSSKIRNTIGLNNFNRAAQTIAIGFSSYKYKDLDYYVAESTTGNNFNNQVLLFDTDREAWTKFSNFTPNAWITMPSSTGQDLMVWGDSSGNVYYFPNIGTYNDVSNSCTAGSCTVTSPSIYSYYQTKWYNFPDASMGDKYFRTLKTYIQNSSLSSTINTQINNDYNQYAASFAYNFIPSGNTWGAGIWGQATWGASLSLNVDREEPNIGKQMFQIKYSNNAQSQDMTILGWEIYIEPTSQL